MEKTRLSLFMMLCLGVQSSEILQRQKRNWIIDSFVIDEGYKGRFPYSLGKIEIEKDLTLFKIKGQGFDEEPKNVLQINENTGEITVHGHVDYEKFRVLKLIFQAFDREKHAIDTQLGIEIKVTDSNDNAPKFYPEMYEISIKESTAQGTEVVTVKATDDDATENNRLFDLKIVSVAPKQQELDFYLKQIEGTQTGTISFYGCLDHETAEKYTIIVEAKDRGEDIQLTSTCTVIINIEDGNNHHPEITGQTGARRVKEGEENVLVSRLQVTDKDTKGTPAWRAKYKIQGDTNNNFKITTDPETNEGLLYVEKHLDYEVTPQMTVTISVENEIPYSSCKVVNRRTTGLWEVELTEGATIGGATGKETLGLSTHQVTVTVEDVNEPPIFDEPNKQVKLVENVEAGRYLETFTARDPDIGSANSFVFTKGDDPAGWIAVDPVTGKVTTSKIIDRESSFVKDGIYTVTVYAVDDGKPSMTSTATLNIHINDENDNAPTLIVSTIDICQSDGPSAANISALDLDEEPYSGPFYFKLLGDVEGKWRVDPRQGYSVNLVKENTVHSGIFKLLLEVSDRQHKAAVHNLSVTVCNCFDAARPNCRSRKATGSTAGAGALGIMFFSILLLAGLVLLAFLMTCKKESKPMPDDGSEQHLMRFNTEKPGTDCEVTFEPLNQGCSQNLKDIKTVSQVPPTTLKQQPITATVGLSQSHSEYSASQMEQRKNYWVTADPVNEASQEQLQRKSVTDQGFTRGNSLHWSMGASSTMRNRQDGNLKRGCWMRGSKYSAAYQTDVHREMLFKALNTMLYNLEASGKELDDHAPHVYAEEGDTNTSYELDAISIPDIPFDPNLPCDLNFRFRALASICMPCESTVYSTKTSSALEKHETTTSIQMESQQTNTLNTRSHF